jgi:hypothetical protein
LDSGALGPFETGLAQTARTTAATQLAAGARGEDFDTDDSDPCTHTDTSTGAVCMPVFPPASTARAASAERAPRKVAAAKPRAKRRRLRDDTRRPLP